MEKILTVPSCVAQETVYVTGNHHVSLSHIAPDGSILSLSHISRIGGCLVEHRGAPLLRLSLDGVPLSAVRAEYVHSFIPTFYARLQDIDVCWQIFAPEGIRGFVIRVSLSGSRRQNACLSLDFIPKDITRSIFRSRPLAADSSFFVDEWTGAAVCEYTSGFGISAIALSGNEGFMAKAEAGRLSVSLEAEIKENETTIAEFYVALGAEADGASLANMDMRRRKRNLFEDYTALLDRRRYYIDDEVLCERLNLNLNFCYYFSIGYPLDCDDMMLMTSKSSRYYVSGAYWARDCMLWAFPAVLRMDAETAKLALLAAFTTYLRQGANHALYLNGAVLYPGFELDELIAPLIALERYVSVTGERGILELPQIRSGTGYILEQLEKWKDDETGLYRTELNPSDDPVGADCLIYCNALALSALRFCGGWFSDISGKIDGLERALLRYTVLTDENKRIFPWAVSSKMPSEIYDDPPGSLLLMPYYGWPERDYEVYKNTVEYFFSERNEYFTRRGGIIGQGCEHAPSPWPMSLCNLLLCGAYDREKLINALRAMPMDNGIACETVNPETGAVSTGAAFATFAGFYANAIIEALEDGD